ncbi:MAG: putative metal-dependent hydrolase [Bryobacterales bacterium]|nr:putative metal-dependent hydrolase [Bryobacterales bacterium]
MDEKSASADLRYPIGVFERPASVSREAREQWIEQIAGLPEQIRGAVDGLSEVRLSTPYRPGGWTVRQVVHHLADAHMDSYIRFRLALTEDEPLVKPYLEARWAELPDARDSGVEVSLMLLDSLHERWVRLLRAMKDEEFARTYRHPTAGVSRLDTTVALYAWHGRHHVAQIDALRERMGWQ